jgi:glycosyltransferase involved in cell wall biosynthesis
MQSVINVCTPGSPDPADSFGLIAVELSRHLARLGCGVNLYAMGPREVPFQDEEIAAIIRQPIVASTGAVMLGYPTIFNRYPGLMQLGKRVGICMFESSRVPPTWPAELNRCSAIITPCQFCKDIFEEAGVTAPIHVLPLGINPIYQPAERTEGRPFTFLAFIDRGMRKGGVQALSAFQHAFGDDMDYRLILKGRKSKITAEILNPNVELIQEDYSEEQMSDLFYRTDVVVANATGEGFGLIPRQGAATGAIALATDFAGTKDHIDQWGIPIPCKLVKADWAGHSQFTKMDLGQWAKIDTGALAELLGDIADNRDYYRRRAARLAGNVQRLYSWEAFARGVLDVWEGC